MGHQPHLAVTGEEDPPLLHEGKQRLGVPFCQLQEDHVGLHLGQIQGDAGQGGQPFGQTSGPAVIVRQAGDVLFEGKQTGLGQDPRLTHAAPQHLAQPSGAGDEGARAHQQRSHRRPQPLGEADGDAVKGSSQFVYPVTARHGGIEQARPVQMQLQPALVDELAHRLQVVKRQHLAIVGVFEADQPGLHKMGIVRGDGCRHIGHRQRTVCLHGNGLQRDRTQHGAPLGLIAIDVGPLAHDGPLTALTVTHHRQQVGHGAGGNKQRGLLAQQLGPAGLQCIDAGIFPVDIIPHLGMQHALAHGIRGLGDRITS